MQAKQRYDLQHPIQHGEETISFFELRRPKLKHLKLMDGIEGDMAQFQALMVEIADQPGSVIDELDATDFKGLVGIIKGFLGESAEDGKTTSLH